MKVVKTDKHYMAEPDFEIDHYKDASYPPVASHYHEFYETFRLCKGREFYMNETYYIIMICVSFFNLDTTSQKT